MLELRNHEVLSEKENRRLNWVRACLNAGLNPYNHISEPARWSGLVRAARADGRLPADVPEA